MSKQNMLLNCIYIIELFIYKTAYTKFNLSIVLLNSSLNCTE